MADKKNQKEIIPSTLTELALMLLFGFMLTAAHFAKDAAGMQARAEEAEETLRSRALPSCGFHNSARTRPALIFIFEKIPPDHYTVRLNTNYNTIKKAGMIRNLPHNIEHRFSTSKTIHQSNLLSEFSSLIVIDKTSKDACVYNAGIDDIGNIPPNGDKIFYWTKTTKDKPPGSP